MSIPRVVFLATFGAIACADPAKEPIVQASAPQAPATRAERPPSRTVTVRIIVVPPAFRTRGVSIKDDDRIKDWLRARPRAVQPWDIIVIGTEPWMFTHDHLVPHEHKPANYHFELGAVHVSVVPPRRDEIVWESDTRFCITGIKKELEKEGEAPKESAPDKPYPQLPIGEPNCSGSTRVASGPPAEFKPSQVPQRYKITLSVGGQTIDPDAVCER